MRTVNNRGRGGGRGKGFGETHPFSITCITWLQVACSSTRQGPFTVQSCICESMRCPMILSTLYQDLRSGPPRLELCINCSTLMWLRSAFRSSARCASVPHNSKKRSQPWTFQRSQRRKAWNSLTSWVFFAHFALLISMSGCNSWLRLAMTVFLVTGTDCQFVNAWKSLVTHEVYVFSTLHLLRTCRRKCIVYMILTSSRKWDMLVSPSTPCSETSKAGHSNKPGRREEGVSLGNPLTARVGRWG